MTPRPGTDRDNLLSALRNARQDASNLQGVGPKSAHTRLLDYLDWVSDTARLLHGQVSDRDLERLILTRRYEQLFSAVGTLANLLDERVLNGLVALELGQRVDAFNEAITAIETQVQRWQPYGNFVVPDTSFFIQHEQKLEKVEFGPVLNVWQSPVNLLVPIVVVDELDALKESRDRRVRWRAGYTLAVLDRLFDKTSGRARLRAAPSIAPAPGKQSSSEITVELLFDPPGHQRLPIADDEIVDRALTIEPLASRRVTLLTYDTGQSMRARAAGLQAVKLRKEIGDEPEQGDLKEERSKTR